MPFSSRYSAPNITRTGSSNPPTQIRNMTALGRSDISTSARKMPQPVSTAQHHTQAELNAEARLPVHRQSLATRCGQRQIRDPQRTCTGSPIRRDRPPRERRTRNRCPARRPSATRVKRRKGYAWRQPPQPQLSSWTRDRSTGCGGKGASRSILAQGVPSPGHNVRGTRLRSPLARPHPSV